MFFADLISTTENLDPTTPVNEPGVTNAVTSSEDVVDADAEVKPDEMSESQATDSETELDSADSTVDAIDTGIDSAVGAVDTLTEVQDTLATDNESESMTPVEEQSVQITHESIMKNLGLDMPFPTLEGMAIGSRRSQLIATLESDKKGILSRIADGVKAAGRALLSFVQGLIRNTWVLRKYCDFVKKKAAALKNGASAKESSMTQSAGAMSVGGEAGMSSVKPMLDTAMGCMAISDKLVDKVNSLNFKLSADEETKLDLSSMASGQSLPSRREGVVGYLTGDRAFHDPSIISMVISGATPYTDTKDKDHTPQRAEKIAVAGVQDINTLLKSADQILAALKSFDSKHSKIKTMISTLVNYAAGVLTFYPSLVNKTANKAFHMQANLMAARVIMSKGLSRLPLEAWKTAKAFIDYANNSVKQYQGGEGGAAPAEAEDDTVHKANWEVA